MATKRKTERAPRQSSQLHIKQLRHQLEERQRAFAVELGSWIRSFPDGDQGLLRLAANVGRRDGRDAAEALWSGWTTTEAEARTIRAQFRHADRIARKLVSKEESARVRADARMAEK